MASENEDDVSPRRSVGRSASVSSVEMNGNYHRVIASKQLHGL